MNNKRRSTLKMAIELLDKASNYISIVLEEEQECLDNMPENFEASDKYEKMEMAVDNLEYAIDGIEEMKEKIQEASE